MNKRLRLTAGFQALVMVIVLMAAVMIPQKEVQAAPAEVPQAALGIDVSRYQGLIDWEQVAASGIQFAMIRIGYRTQETGVLNEDPFARYNLQEAQRVGIKTGAYFFSTAVTAAEAVEEAMFTANILDKYKITYPVAYDCENYNSATSRQKALDKTTRTALAIHFLDTIASRGYTPMFYSSKNAMENSRDWDMATLSARYKVWAAWYPQQPFPLTPACTYTGIHHMWQYTDKAVIAGINGGVDMNVAYFNYTGIAEAKDPTGAPIIPASAVGNVQFTDVQQVVTPNTAELNLRTVPSTVDDNTIVVKINPGDMIFRTGIGNNGWSRVVLNGQVLYAYSSYLTKVL
ncbi:MAG: glycoside hydrolase family 25 protein [Lachnospiraceae bacterium]|nr:glycoside hydrolase family 25 protein [Lachnospiraceae bacterium]